MTILQAERTAVRLGTERTESTAELSTRGSETSGRLQRRIGAGCAHDGVEKAEPLEPNRRLDDIRVERPDEVRLRGFYRH